MLSKLRRHAPLAVALLALFFAIGGPSFAADTAGSAVKRITGKQVKDNSLTTKDVKNRSLLKADFKAGQLPGGAQGPKGDKGETGTVDTSNFYDKSQSDTKFGSSAKTDTAGFGLFLDSSTCQESISPSVSVDVGPSGLVSVYVEGEISRPGTGTAASVYLYEPTDLPGCERVLRSTMYAPAELRRSMPGSSVGTTGRGSWLIFHATPGTRTYSLRFGAEGGAGGALPLVDKKVLSVIPL